MTIAHAFQGTETKRPAESPLLNAVARLDRELERLPMRLPPSPLRAEREAERDRLLAHVAAYDQQFSTLDAIDHRLIALILGGEMSAKEIARAIHIRVEAARERLAQLKAKLGVVTMGEVWKASTDAYMICRPEVKRWHDARIQRLCRGERRARRRTAKAPSSRSTNRT